nr:class I SAM-dependent methyltransferase [uncultured Methanospirillum sp.]
MRPLINWEELRNVTRPPFFSHMSEEEQKNLWNNEAEFYDYLIKMEVKGTFNALQCIPISSVDSVLDVGCGPGRITSQLAKIAGKVTALDISEKMMERCREKVRDYSHVETILMDWNCAEPDINLPRHDIVIASRSIGGEDIKKLSKFAKKYAAIISWANAPSIPEIRSLLFDSARKKGYPIKKIPFTHDRRLQYNLQYNLVYDLGYEPNINIVQDGFERYYPSKEDAYSDLQHLIGDPEELNLDVFKENVDQFLTYSSEKGYRFFFETRTFVLWWETLPKQFLNHIFESKGDLR